MGGFEQRRCQKKRDPESEVALWDLLVSNTNKKELDIQELRQFSYSGYDKTTELIVLEGLMQPKYKT